uniref:Uncharacterized protein n=1 Tax=Oryza brachyantha TaxID=4533 RepID=J3MCH7_ORYBR
MKYMAIRNIHGTKCQERKRQRIRIRKKNNKKDSEITSIPSPKFFSSEAHAAANTNYTTHQELDGLIEGKDPSPDGSSSWREGGGRGKTNTFSSIPGEVEAGGRRS